MLPLEKIPESGQRCACCGGIMELEGKPYASRITVEGVYYYCNNPACYCENPQGKGDKK